MESLINNFSSFLKELKKKGYADSTIKRKEGHLSSFKNWIYAEKLENFPANKIEQKHIKRYEKSLKGKTNKDHLKTIISLLEYSGNKKISFEEESDIQKIINHYFKTKGYSLEEIKEDARKKKIIYSRYTKPSKDLLELAGSVEKAKKAIDKVAEWANSRNLDYAIETVFKKWPEINKLKPKEKKNRPYFRGDPMVWSSAKQKWYVINKSGDWLEFAGKEEEIEWKIEDY